MRCIALDKKWIWSSLGPQLGSMASVRESVREVFAEIYTGLYCWKVHDSKLFMFAYPVVYSYLSSSDSGGFQGTILQWLIASNDPNFWDINEALIGQQGYQLINWMTSLSLCIELRILLDCPLLCCWWKPKSFHLLSAISTSAGPSSPGEFCSVVALLVNLADWKNPFLKGIPSGNLT